MKVYIAGPMRGYPQFNFPAFDKAQKQLEDIGHVVVSPADLDRKAGMHCEQSETGDESWLPGDKDRLKREVICRDVKAICDGCEAVVLLPGWEDSKGVAVEIAVAKFIGIPTKQIASFLEESI